jgi:hypothetical protein
VIDTTVRGFVYEAAGTVPSEALTEGERIVQALGERNVIPVAVLGADPLDTGVWLDAAHAEIDVLLLGR